MQEEELVSVHEDEKITPVCDQAAAVQQADEKPAVVRRGAHPGFFWGMCTMCGHREGSMPDNGCLGEPAAQGEDAIDGYVVVPEAGGMKMHLSELERIRKKSKPNQTRLTLVLDLDHTLLNTCHFSALGEQHVAMLNQLLCTEHKDCPQGVHDCDAMLHRIPWMQSWTKLRPHTRDFLRNVSESWQLYINTMGDRNYAEAMARLLDPNKTLFGSRIISRNDQEGKTKTLEILEESLFLILDDSGSVWPKHEPNLLIAPRYHFFPQSSRDFGAGNSLLESRRDEDLQTGWLAAVEQILGRVHTAFFASENLETADVRKVLAAEKSKVLAGVHLIFSGVIHNKRKKPESSRWWRLAVSLGATVHTEQSDEVTHVVAILRGAGNKTEKVRWAIKRKLPVVGVGWLEACGQMWSRMSEAEFPPASENLVNEAELALKVAGGGTANQAEAPAGLDINQENGAELDPVLETLQTAQAQNVGAVQGTLEGTLNRVPRE
eukprot:TRINITY_DN5949_c0_g1_i1.p1 TRINITY_DN5949_c0_g1~~TRINITY_DN5949_c0_g1_i1.p1  ORF type:complete len:491 (-),score=100.50 TRINITY_DN5949_c0_g1_i1:11-1483(-)